MPSFVLKPDRDRDLYVGWSTVVDNFVWVADRVEALEILRFDIPPGYSTPDPGHAPEDRLRRADENGTSAQWPRVGGYFGGWDDTALMVEQRGLLLRVDLARYVDAYVADDEDAAFALLQPFDDASQPTEEST